MENSYWGKGAKWVPDLLSSLFYRGSCAWHYPVGNVLCSGSEISPAPRAGGVSSPIPWDGHFVQFVKSKAKLSEVVKNYFL